MSRMARRAPKVKAPNATPTPIPAFAPVLSVEGFGIGDGETRFVFCPVAVVAALVMEEEDDDAVVEAVASRGRVSRLAVGAWELKPAAA